MLSVLFRFRNSLFSLLSFRLSPSLWASSRPYAQKFAYSILVFSKIVPIIL